MIIQKHCLTCTVNGHNKFYILTFEEDKINYIFSVRWGAIDTIGQYKVLLKVSNITNNLYYINQAYQKKLDEKLNKGYEIIEHFIGEQRQRIKDLKTYYEKSDKFWAIYFDRDNLEIKIKTGTINSKSDTFIFKTPSIENGEMLLIDKITNKINLGYKPIW